MRRETLYKSVSRIVNDINECEVIPFLENILDSMAKEREKPIIPLEIFQKYMLATQNYNDKEIEICKILGLSQLLETGFWKKLFSILRNNELSPFFHDTLFHLRFATMHLPKILSLAKQEYVQEIKEHLGELPEEFKGKSLLSALIIEDKGQYSHPNRLISVINSITNLYSVVAILENETENDLIVLACDSGSDKSFDFLGLAKLVEQVKEIIVSLWDRVVFHRQKRASLGIALVAESLPILKKINELSESGSIGKEQAEILKRKTIAGATQFLEAGAMIPELEAESFHDPKQLMKPEPKLLASPWDVVSSNEKRNIKKQVVQNDNVDTDALSDDEKHMLELLLKKSKKKPKRKSIKESKK